MLSTIRETRAAGVDQAAYPYLQGARHEGSGVTLNQVQDDSLILLTGFIDGQNEIRLIERDGTVVARWPVSFTGLFPNPAFLRTPPVDDFRVDIHGASALPDGSVVFNLEYSGTAKLDRCGNTVWTLRHPTHHSVERAEGGGFWIPGRADYARRDAAPAYPPFTSIQPELPLEDDLILRVSDDGEILEQHSVTQILYDSGLEAKLTATGELEKSSRFTGEIVHLNKIAELPSAYADAFPDFRPGDLLISLRAQNMIAVIDPETWRVRWHQTGPWLRQHDPEFIADGSIDVFNNNAYTTSLLEDQKVNPELPLVSDIQRVHPTTHASEAVYGGVDGQRFMTVVRGKIDPVPAGGYLITEFEAGRAFQTDAAGATVWEYVNRYDADRVAELTEARLYPRSYFEQTNWSCQ